MMLPKLPKFPKLFPPKGRKKLHVAAASRRTAQPVEESYDEPQTNFSSAIIVVLILHLVAVGGIYAFQGIKAHRKTQEVAAVAVEPAAAKPAASVVQQVETPPVSKSPVSKPPPNTKPEVVERAPVAPAAAISPITGVRVHHVKSGENLTRIAAMYNVSVGELEEVNGGAKSVATLRAGQVLNLPKSKPAAAAVKKTETTPKAAAKPLPKTYVVAKGDIPEIIARKLGVNYQELLKLNNIEDPTKLQVGRTLKVPQKKN
ncbi:MAG: LysM/M23/M37 peptidase [Chthoniobacteraceae bacterium]|nr:LysM/M23/M37 peptidase [Chthoniobacteraceae bacterium]